MSEYTEVEQPFLQQLQGLGWQIIDQGTGNSQRPEQKPAPEFSPVVAARGVCQIRRGAEHHRRWQVLADR